MRLEDARRLLGVRVGAGSEEVDRRFRELARHHHPDAGGDAERFRELVIARTVLTRRGQRSPLLVIPDRPWWRDLLAALLALANRRRREDRTRVR